MTEDARIKARNDARNIILRVVPCTDYLEKSKSGNYCCPICGSGKGVHGTGALKYYPETNTCCCFSKCALDIGAKGKKYDVIDLHMHKYGLDYDAALKDLARINGISLLPNDGEAPQRAQKTPQGDNRGADREKPADTLKTAQKAAEGAAKADYTEYYKICRGRLDDPAAISYLSARGISAEIARAHWIGYDPAADTINAPGGKRNGKNFFPAPRLIYPATKSFYTTRRIDGNTSYEKMNCGTPAIFNCNALYTSETQEVFVTEGVISALSIIEGKAAAIALNSANNAGLLIEQLKEKKTPATLILCCDNDEKGRAATSKLEEELKCLGVKYIDAAGMICRDGEDPNDALLRDRAAFVEAIQNAIRTARKDELTLFWEKIQTEAYKPHKTGLDFFDNLLGGGVIMQTVLLLLAAPATGKTTLCQTIAEEIAKRGKPVIYLNLEMSKEQMIAKSISAKVSKKDKDNPMTINDVLQGYSWTEQQRQRVYDALVEYRETIHPFIKYNPDNINSDIDRLTDYLAEQGEKAKRDGNPAPAVVLDYLHLITSNANIDIQELIKKAVNGIKGYCVKYNTFAIIISATNRNKGRITMESGRDSSNIEFGGDALISLNYWEVDQGIINPEKEAEFAPIKEAPYRHMILRVLKARFYQAGRYSKFYYHPATNIFFPENAWLPIGKDKITPFPLESVKERDTRKEKQLKESEARKRAAIPKRG